MIAERKRSTLFILHDKNDHSEQDRIEFLSYPNTHIKKGKQRENRSLWAHWYHKCFGILLLCVAFSIWSHSTKARSIYKDVIKVHDSLGCRRQKKKNCFHLIICLNRTLRLPGQEKQWVLNKWLVSCCSKKGVQLYTASLNNNSQEVVICCRELSMCVTLQINLGKFNSSENQLW